ATPCCGGRREKHPHPSAGFLHLHFILYFGTILQPAQLRPPDGPSNLNDPINLCKYANLMALLVRKAFTSCLFIPMLFSLSMVRFLQFERYGPITGVTSPCRKRKNALHGVPWPSPRSQKGDVTKISPHLGWAH
uniref:Uncharacterized protein n=1 Tax=Apteryx owenii TaxID=8824 RepID=A0A8B9Q2X3_APTOW